MNQPRRDAGFTLIELLVVIGILSMLMVVLLPQVFSSASAADRLGTKKNMEAIWTWHKVYSDRHSRQLAPKTGHQFVLMPWVEKVCQRTQQNFGRFWVEGANEPRRQELDKQGQIDGWDTVWESYGDVSSEDTHFAGPSKSQLRKLTLADGTQPMMATDNEYSALFADGTVIIMMGDKSFVELGPDILREKYGFDISENPDEGFAVGPDSEDEQLQKLEF